MGSHEKEEAGPWGKKQRAESTMKLQREKREPPTFLWTLGRTDDKTTLKSRLVGTSGDSLFKLD